MFVNNLSSLLIKVIKLTSLPQELQAAKTDIKQEQGCRKYKKQA